MGVERTHVAEPGAAAQPAQLDPPQPDASRFTEGGLAGLLHHGDAATIARAVSGIQRRHGNVATGRLVRAAISRTATGLADAAATTRFVGVAKTLATNWVKLATPEARAKLLTDAALAELKTLKVPEYAVSVTDTGSNAGAFDFQTWTMEIGKSAFEGALPGRPRSPTSPTRSCTSRVTASSGSAWPGCGRAQARSRRRSQRRCSCSRASATRRSSSR